MRVTSPVVIFASTPSHGFDSTTWQTRTNGAGNTVSWNRDTRSVDFSLVSPGYVVRQSYAHLPYQLGRPVRWIFTGNTGNHVDGIVREWGQMDARNGTLWRRKADGTFSLAVRSSVTGAPVELEINQSHWDGESVSFNPSMNNVFICEYVWLGAFCVRWGIGMASGVKYVHTHVFADTLPFSYMQTANLPARWAAYTSITPSSPATMRQVCSEIESEGGYITHPAATFTARRPVAQAVAVAAAPTETPILALRPKLLVGMSGSEIVNRITSAIDNVVVYGTAAADWSLWYYPPGVASPVSGGSWDTVNDLSCLEANDSPTALSLAGGYRIAGGTVVANGTGGNSRGLESASISQVFPIALDICGNGDPLTSDVGGSPSHVVVSATGTGNVSCTMNWRQGT
jgi:hypothetical protein